MRESGHEECCCWLEGKLLLVSRRVRTRIGLADLLKKLKS